ncbi:MAG: glycine cleavage system protein GcvH [Schleiferiaceae bacterium]|nr:glycine cleavage system protein GcvH [Schleiferiaceae bacterium]
MNVPTDLRYSKDHEWLRIEGDIAIIGITDFAQGELGDIVFVDIPTEGETMDAEEVFGSVEAVKTVSDLFLPVGGEIMEVNPDLDAAPETVNSDAYGAGWMVKIKMSDPSEAEALMDASAYAALIGA